MQFKELNKPFFLLRTFFFSLKPKIYIIWLLLSLSLDRQAPEICWRLLKKASELYEVVYLVIPERALTMNQRCKNTSAVKAKHRLQRTCMTRRSSGLPSSRHISRICWRWRRTILCTLSASCFPWVTPPWRLNGSRMGSLSFMVSLQCMYVCVCGWARVCMCAHACVGVWVCACMFVSSLLVCQ